MPQAAYCNALSIHSLLLQESAVWTLLAKHLSLPALRRPYYLLR